MRSRSSLSLHTAMFLWMAPFLAATAAVCAYLAYAQVYDAILHGFDRRLSAAAGTTAAFIRGDDHKALMDRGADTAGGQAEDSELYRKYSLPMQRIMNEGGLTYHYTVRLKDREKIIYGIDATEGEDHSFLGTEEENPPEEAERLWTAVRTGTISTSPIQKFDIWGQLKIANAPIVDSSGTTVALVGADVNISVIDKKTRVAFLHILGAGILALGLAAVMTWCVARRVALPLQQLKAFALKLGGGDFSEEMPPLPHPELRNLHEALTALGGVLKETPANGNGQWNSGSEWGGTAVEPFTSHSGPRVEGAACSTTDTSDERLAILREFSPFHALSAGELQVLANAASLTTYRPGALICSHGTVPPAALCVADGMVTGDRSSAVPGLVGFTAIILDRPLGDDLRADPEDGARCLVVRKEHLFTLLHECPAFLKGLMESELGGMIDGH